MFIWPGDELCPSPGSDHILPPGKRGPEDPAVGCGVDPCGPPGRAGLKLQLPSAALSTSGEGGVAPPGAGCGCAWGACGDWAVASLVGARCPPCAGCDVVVLFAWTSSLGIFGSCTTSKSVPLSPGARFFSPLCTSLSAMRVFSASPGFWSLPGWLPPGVGFSSSWSCDVCVARVSWSTWLAWSAMKCAFGLSCWSAFTCWRTAMRRSLSGSGISGGFWSVFFSTTRTFFSTFFASSGAFGFSSGFSVGAGFASGGLGSGGGGGAASSFASSPGSLSATSKVWSSRRARLPAARERRKSSERSSCTSATTKPPVPKRKCAQMAAQIQSARGMVTSRVRICRARSPSLWFERRGRPSDSLTPALQVTYRKPKRRGEGRSSRSSRLRRRP